jgi:hypothetical protein
MKPLTMQPIYIWRYGMSSVTSPIMGAVDAMPKEFRELANEIGYIEVYRAWKAGYTSTQIRQRVKTGVSLL